MSQDNFIQRIKDIVGNEFVATNPTTLVNYGYDASPYSAKLPLAVVFPDTTEEVSKIMKVCNEFKQPVIVRGAGSNLTGSTIAATTEIILDMKRFDSILETDLENLTMTVEAGVVTNTIALKAQEFGLLYPPDPGSIRVSTIGGNIAENSGGLRGLKYGVTGDYVLGLTAVMPNGDIIKTGGKLTKDVAGYNLTQLIVGSEGTLAVVTEVILKLIVQPNYKKTMTAYFDLLPAAGDAVSQIIKQRIIPATLEIIDKMTLQVIENHAKIGLDCEKEAFLLIEQDGDEHQVDADMEVIASICRELGATVHVAQSTDEALEISKARRNALGALASLAPTTILEDATVPRSRVGDFLRGVNEISQRHDVDIYTFGHAGDGNMHPTAPCDIRNVEHYKRVELAFEDIFKLAVDMGGTITGEHGVGKMKAPYLELKVKKSGIDAMRMIKLALDPNNIMNPSIMFYSEVK